MRRLGAVHGGFEFREAAHEPGRKRLLGRSYRENGEREAADALSDLARHPSTARFIATKLARHFIADDPPAEAISRLATTFLETDGDLTAVSRALITIDAVWATPLPKVKRPHELVISALRATAIDSLPARAFIRDLPRARAGALARALAAGVARHGERLDLARGADAAHRVGAGDGRARAPIAIGGDVRG